MKRILLTLAIIAIAHFSYAQFSTSSGNTTTSDNVGVGSASPQSKLEVTGSGYAATKLITLSENEPTRYSGNIGITVSGGTRLNLGTRNDNVNFDNTLNLFDGNVGIGTASPIGLLDAQKDQNGSTVIYARNSSTGSSANSQFIATNGTGTTQFGQLGTAFSNIGLLANHSSFILSNGNSNGLRLFTLGSTNLTLGTNNTAAMTILPGGNTGIGTTSPANILEVSSIASYETQIAAVSSINNDIFGFRLQNTGTGGQDWRLEQGRSATGSFEIYNGTNTVTPLTILPGGNVGIGTTDPQGYKLAVNGNAIAESMTVKLHGSWPDYVFQSKYTLPSLNVVKAYIDQNQHLPDMPSEAEVAKNGINLGEMNMKLLKKVEELTLYAIEQQKHIDKLEEEQTKSTLQNVRVAALEATLLKLTANK